MRAKWQTVRNAPALPSAPSAIQDTFSRMAPANHVKLLLTDAPLAASMEPTSNALLVPIPSTPLLTNNQELVPAKTASTNLGAKPTRPAQLVRPLTATAQSAQEPLSATLVLPPSS